MAQLMGCKYSKSSKNLNEAKKTRNVFFLDTKSGDFDKKKAHATR